MPEPIQPVFGLIPLAAGVAAAAGAIASRRRTRSSEHSTSRASLAWSLVFALLLLVMAGLTIAGLFGAGVRALVGYTVLTMVFSYLSLKRDDLARVCKRLLDRTPLSRRTWRVVGYVLAMLVVVALGVLALEVPYSDTAFSIAPRYAVVEGGIVALALLALLALSQGTGVGPALGVGALFAIGVAQFYVRVFKSAAILPGDLFALGTAAAVSGGYSYVFDDGVVLGLLIAELAVCVLSMLRPARHEHRLRSVLCHLGAAAVSAAALAALVTVPDYQALYGVVTNQLYWYSMDYYQQQGFLTTFVMVAQKMPIPVPDGYTEQGAQDIESSYAAAYDQQQTADDTAAQEQFSQKRPSVVVVMNETFSDLSVYQGLAEETGYAGPTYFKDGLTDALAKGPLTVSVVGGGTCNTEFEFLTGTSMAYVGEGKYPYSIYDLSSAPSMVRQFRDLGYQTTAIHPNWPSNWNRNKIYPELGFDRFLSYDDGTFDGDEWYHNGISDAATYQHVLDTLKSSEEPQFVFDVTMQNHGGYDKNNIPAEDLPGYHASRLDDGQNAKLNEYLACINKSDQALADFVQQLRELDRPVVLVFFGDHQPSISPDIDDAYYPGEEDAMAHAQRQRQTVYAVWANYDVAGRDQASSQEQTSVNLLSSQVLRDIGAPLDGYEKAKLVADEGIQAMNPVGYLGRDGVWYDPDADGPYAQTFRDLAQVTYLEFGSKVRH